MNQQIGEESGRPFRLVRGMGGLGTGMCRGNHEGMWTIGGDCKTWRVCKESGQMGEVIGL